MTEITPFLFIGDEGDANNSSLLKEYGIDAVVNVAAEVEPDVPLDILYVSSPLNEPYSFVRPVVSVIATLVKLNRKTVVHCRHGLNRSVAATICALMELGYSEGGARGVVFTKHAGADPVEEIIAEYRKERLNA